jgi:hypothetical protein
MVSAVISAMAALFRMTSASPAAFPTSRNKNAAGDGEQGDEGH